MTTLTDIANLALGAIGADLINSIDSDSATPRKVNRILPAVIDDVATMRNWVCLRQRIKLTQVGERKLGEDVKYISPKDMLNVVEENAPWQRDGDFIYSQCAGLTIKAIIVNYNPDEWCKNFKGAVIAKLKAELIIPIVGDTNLAQAQSKKSEIEIQRYISNDIYFEKNRRVQRRQTWFNPYA